MNDNKIISPYKFQNSTIDVDITMLKQMSDSLLVFFNQSDSTFPASYLDVKNYLGQELNSSAPMFFDGIPGIGLWKLVNHDTSLAFVRYPIPTPGLNFVYHAELALIDSKWKIIAFTHETDILE